MSLSRIKSTYSSGSFIFSCIGNRKALFFLRIFFAILGAYWSSSMMILFEKKDTIFESIFIFYKKQKLLFPRIFLPKIIIKFLKFASENGFTGFLGESDEVLDIVQREEESASGFADMDEMSQIPKWVFFWDAGFIPCCHRYILFRVFVFFISDFKIPKTSKNLAVSPDTGRKYTVKHIDSASNAFYEIFWGTDTHEVVRFVFWEDGCKCVERTVHISLAFTDWESTDGDSRCIEIADKFCRLDA